MNDENLFIFNLSKMMLEKLKNNNEIYSSVAFLETEYNIFGYCGDMNKPYPTKEKSYPTKEYRVLEKGFKLLNEKSINLAETELGRILS